MKKIVGLIFVLFLVTGCQSSGDEGNTRHNEAAENGNTEVTDNNGNNNNDNVRNADKENTQNNGATENENTEAVDNDNVESETDVYGGAQKNPNYFIESEVVDQDNAFYTAFIINRDKDGEQDLSPEDRLVKSLLNSDPSEQNIIESYTDLSLEESNLEIQFNEEGNQLSTTTAQSTLFFDTLFGISDFYGVEEIVFLNPDEKKDITVAERLVDDAISIEEERGSTRGYYTIYDKELGETLFLPGGELDEQIVNENDNPLSFPETVEAMGTIDHEDAFYDSAIVEGIEIVDASITNGVARVQYTMDKDKVTDTDRTVFEDAIQLSALDFHAWEVELMNDTLKESNTYPLVGQ